MNSEEKDLQKAVSSEEDAPLRPTPPDDDEVQNILDRLCASFSEETEKNEEAAEADGGEAPLSEELLALREAVEGVKTGVAFSDGEEDGAEKEETEQPEELEELFEEGETGDAGGEEPKLTVMPPVAEESVPHFDDAPASFEDVATAFSEEASEAADGREKAEVFTDVSEKRDTVSLSAPVPLPSFDEEEDEPPVDVEDGRVLLSPDGEEEAVPEVIRADVSDASLYAVVPPSNRTDEDEDDEPLTVPDRAYRYYEPTATDTAEVEDRLASFRHDYNQYMYAGIAPEEEEAPAFKEETASSAEEAPFSVSDAEPLLFEADDALSRNAAATPEDTFFEEEVTEEQPITEAHLERMSCTAASEEPLVQTGVTEPDAAEGVVSENTEGDAVEKVYPEAPTLIEDVGDGVFGAVSVSDLDTEREPLVDDVDIPEEIASPEPFNADDYVISDRSIGEGMVSGESTREYLSHNQNEDILNGYRTRIRFCTVKLILVSFLAAVLLVTENAFLFGWTLPAFGDGLGVRGLPVLLNLQLIAFIAALSLPILKRGITILRTKKLCTETNAVAMLLLTVVYDAVLYITDAPSPRMFAFCAALYLTFCHIFDIVKTNGDYMTFEVVSSAARKTVAFTSSLGNFPEESSALSEYALSDEAPLSETRRAGFVEGFFSRSSDRGGDDIHVFTVLLALIFSLASFAFSFFAGESDDIVQHFYVFAFSFVAALPVCATFTRRIPFGEAVKKAVLADCAIVGESSAAEFASTEVFALEDVDAFPSRNVKVKGIKLFGENRLDRVLCRVAALFSKVGGPLSGVFGTVGTGGPTVEDVTVTDVTKNGITARLDGDSFLVGNGEFMEQHHVTLYYDSEDARQIESGKISIMYVAENGAIAARFYLQYIPNPAFEKTVERLSEENIAVVLRTFDPNVTDSLLKRVSYVGERQVRVVHREASVLEEDKKPRLNSGIVTTGAPGTLLPVLYRCVRLLRVFRYGRAIHLSAAAISVLVSALLLVFGHFSVLSSAFVGIYQAFWLLPTVLVTKFYLKE